MLLVDLDGLLCPKDFQKSFLLISVNCQAELVDWMICPSQANRLLYFFKHYPYLEDPNHF